MPLNLYAYEKDDGTVLTGLTLEQANAEEEKERLAREQREMDAKLGPQISAGIHNYEARKLQGQGQPVQQQPVNNTPAPTMSIQSMGGDGNIQPVPQQSQFDTSSTPTFDSLVSNPTSISGMSNSFRSAPSAQEKRASADFEALTEGVPDEFKRDLIARYRMGELKPSAFVKEVIAIKKTLNDAKMEKEKAQYLSDNKVKEMQAEQPYLDARQINQIESQQKMNREDNQTQLEGYRIQSESNRDSARAQQAALKAGEFDVREKDMLQSVEEGKVLLSGIVETFKNNNFGGFGSVIGEGAAKIPLAGKFVAGKNKEYQNQKRLAAETWLRAATGAAAPEYEVSTYTNFLPNESDPPEIADKKVQNFFNKLSSKVSARAKIFEIEGQTLEQRGLTDLANIKYTQSELIKQMIDNARSSIPTIVEKKKEEKSFIQPEKTEITQPIQVGKYTIKKVQ